jgi:ABC-type transport system involved in multi-copper enzyme maturation permease subunit
MTFLPIVDRELRATARRPKTYWLRLAAALGALGICLWVCLWSLRGQPPVTMGRALFSALTVLTFGYCLLLGPFITADSISEEKREGTLGLLFLTDLHSYDVVLGKWIASSMAAFYGLLAILPALGLPLLLGGVTPGEYGRVALAVVNAILFSLAGGLLVSTLSREQAKSALGSFVVIMAMSGLIPGIATACATHFFTKPLNQLPAVVLASPAYSGYLALEAPFRAAPRQFWLSLGIVHAIFWGFMLAVVVLVPRLWSESGGEKPATCRWFWRFGYGRGWRRRFKRRLEKNPVFAMAARMRWPHLVFWTLVTLVALNVFWLTYGYRRSPGTAQFHQYFSHALVFLNRVWVAAMACRFILELRRTGMLELLLTSPVPVRTILRGHWRALRHFFFWPIGAIALIHVFYVVASQQLYGGSGIPRLSTLNLSGVAAAISMGRFLADVVALCWVGTWLGLAMRKSSFAVLAAFASVIVIPWGLGYFFPVQRFTTSLTAATSYWSVYGVQAAGWLTKDLLFTLWAWYKLRKHFRAAAAQVHRRPVAGARWWWPFGRRTDRLAEALVVAPGAVRDA